MPNWLKPIPALLLLTATSILSVATSYATDITLRETLASAVNIIQLHTRTEMARLNVVSIAESQQYAITTSNRIAGYPFTGKLANLDKEKSQQLAKLLLDKNNYANIRQRCLNDYFHGIRFSKDQQKIEFALGIPCNQVVIAFHDGEVIKWWGGILGDDAVSKVITLLGE